jgi:hypothetical protein
MKIFNLRLIVNIEEIAELPDVPEEPPKPTEPKRFNDDPIDKAEAMLNRYIEKVNGPPRVPGMAPSFGMGGDNHNITENIRISAATFEDLQQVLRRFHQVIRELPQVPDSVVRQAVAAAMNPDMMTPR